MAPSMPPATRPVHTLPAIDHGNARDAQRSRELYKYFQPPVYHEVQHLSLCHPSDSCCTRLESRLESSTDPALTSFALLTANLLSCRRSMISLIDQEYLYVIAESTRSLSITSPHTYNPGDALWLGGSAAVKRVGGLCERTVSLLEPNELINGRENAFIFEVPDLTEEPVYMNEDYVVNWPNMRYYAGAPLRTREGISIGSLCVIDDQPRPAGLREQEKLTLVKMAETVMKHLENVQAERDLKRGRDMELGISRFLAGNFRLGGVELDNQSRCDEKLKSEGGIQGIKSVDVERLSWVQMDKQKHQKAEVGISGEDIETAKLPDWGPDEWRLRKELDPFARDFGSDLRRASIAPDETCSDGIDSGLTNVKTSQLPLSFPSPLSEEFHSGINPDASLYLANQVNIPELSRKFSYTSVRSGKARERNGSTSTSTSTSSLSNTNPPSSPPDSLFRDSDSVAHCSAATTPTGQLQPTTSDINSAFRSTFARASVLIRKSIGVDGVVFVDADLEETYDVDDHLGELKATPPQPQQYSQRPKKCRRRSGILGFATKAGSSCLNPFNSDSVMCRRGSELERTLGFDIGEVDEAFLHRVATMWPHGRIFSCNQPGNTNDLDLDGGAEDDSDPAGRYTKESDTLKRFLPGSNSVVLMPLYDFSGKLFAIGFAWTCSKTRVFGEDAEKSYMAAFGNSIMAEVGRLHCVSADKAKGDFISSVSHELRSPLHGILASAEFLADTSLDSFQRSFVDTVESCGRTLLDTINHVLDFSKLNSFGNKWAGARSSAKKESVVRRRRNRSGSLSSLSQISTQSDGEETERKPLATDNLSRPVNDVVHLTAETDLSAILEEVTEGLFAGYEFKGISTPGIMEVVGTPKLDMDGRPVSGVKNDITVIIDIDRCEDGWVFETQPGALRRIFLNLGGNAIKYTDSGWVRIRMKVEDLPPSGDEQDVKSLVTLIFTDSGKGISREFLKTRLFTPFSQENPLVSGTGLGMSIVRQIVEMLGGEIVVKSQLGKGTEVAVSLVLKRGAKAKVPQKISEKGTGEKEMEIQEIKRRTAGKRVSLCGFDGLTPESGAHIRAYSYMNNSFERYLTKWFGMEVVVHSLSDADSDNVDLVISHEGPMVNAHLAFNKGGIPNMAGKDGGPPLIVICSNAARHEIYQPLNKAQNKGIVDFVSKPCGPWKLAKALVSCLDQMEAVSRTPTREKCTVLTETGGQMLVGYSGTVSPFKSTRFLPLTDLVSPIRTNDISCLPSKKIIADTGIPTTLIPYSPKPPESDGSPIAQWKQEIERISSRNTSETNKSLPSTLIVEDNPVNLMLLATFLKKKGYPFEKATNGLEAFQAVEKRSEAFDIILMDLQMPIMSGIESTRAIRRLEQQRRRKGSLIIALTGLATANDQLDAFEGGIDLFMVKPVSFKHLEKTLQEFNLGDRD